MCRFQQIVEHFFKDYGRLVAKWPLLFILSSSFMASILTASFVWNLQDTLNRINDDQFRLFLPENSESIKNLYRLRSMFSISSRDAYDVFQSTYAYFILIPTDNERNVFTDNVMKIASELIEEIKSIKIKISWMEASWSNLCFKRSRVCLEHPLFTALSDNALGSFDDRLSAIRPLLTYPTARFADQVIDNSLMFGSVITGDNGEILKASAMRVPFLLQLGDSLERKMLNEMWQREFVRLVQTRQYKNLSVYVSSSISWKDEMDKNGTMLISYLPALFAVLVIFSVACCCTSDWISSQPWLGFCGVLSALLAVSSAFGVLFFFQYQYLQVVIIMPFLVLSISADNAFLMLNAWRNTSQQSNLEKRMAKTMSQSAVSILIAALTDGLSFAVGSASQFPAVRIFCTYCAVAILFAFIYQTTFFAACLTLCGRRELANRHCLTLQKWNKSPKVINSESTISMNLSKILSTCLNNNFAKVAVVLVYATYLAFSVYGVANSELRLNMSNLVPYDSYVIGERLINDLYYSDYNGYAQAVVITENLKLHDLSIIGRLIDLYETLCATSFSSKGEFWLNAFMDAYATSRNLSLSESNFLSVIRNFLDDPLQMTIKDDVLWSEDGQQIRATRMFIRLRHVGATNQSMAAHALRQRFSESHLPGFITDPITFLLADQNDAVLGCVLQDAAIATGVIIVIVLIFLPNVLCAIWIGLSILSINVGVIGFLSLWRVQIDTISMMTTVMSVGLSVDYVAHVTYHYLITKSMDPYFRLYSALEHAGWSSIQSAAATALGASTLAFVDSYMIKTFVKTVILVIIFGLLHGLVFLPVALSAFVPADQYLETNNYGRVRSYISTTLRDATRKPQRRLTSYFTRRYFPKDQAEEIPSAKLERGECADDSIKGNSDVLAKERRKVRRKTAPVQQNPQNHQETLHKRNDLILSSTTDSYDSSPTETSAKSSASLAWTSISSKCLLPLQINTSTSDSSSAASSPFYDSPPEETQTPDILCPEKLSERPAGELVKIVIQSKKTGSMESQKSESGSNGLLKTFQPSAKTDQN